MRILVALFRSIFFLIVLVLFLAISVPIGLLLLAFEESRFLVERNVPAWLDSVPDAVLIEPSEPLPHRRLAWLRSVPPPLHADRMHPSCRCILVPVHPVPELLEAADGQL